MFLLSGWTQASYLFFCQIALAVLARLSLSLELGGSLLTSPFFPESINSLPRSPFFLWCHVRRPTHLRSSWLFPQAPHARGDHPVEPWL